MTPSNHHHHHHHHGTTTRRMKLADPVSTSSSSPILKETALIPTTASPRLQRQPSLSYSHASHTSHPHPTALIHAFTTLPPHLSQESPTTRYAFRFETAHAVSAPPPPPPGLRRSLSSASQRRPPPPPRTPRASSPTPSIAFSITSIDTLTFPPPPSKLTPLRRSASTASSPSVRRAGSIHSLGASTLNDDEPGIPMRRGGSPAWEDTEEDSPTPTSGAATAAFATPRSGSPVLGEDTCVMCSWDDEEGVHVEEDSDAEDDTGPLPELSKTGHLTTDSPPSPLSTDPAPDTTPTPTPSPFTHPTPHNIAITMVQLVGKLLDATAAAVLTVYLFSASYAVGVAVQVGVCVVPRLAAVGWMAGRTAGKVAWSCASVGVRVGVGAAWRVGRALDPWVNRLFDTYIPLALDGIDYLRTAASAAHRRWYHPDHPRGSNYPDDDAAAPTAVPPPLRSGPSPFPDPPPKRPSSVLGMLFGDEVAAPTSGWWRRRGSSSSSSSSDEADPDASYVRARPYPQYQGPEEHCKRYSGGVSYEDIAAAVASTAAPEAADAEDEEARVRLPAWDETVVSEGEREALERALGEEAERGRRRSEPRVGGGGGRRGVRSAPVVRGERGWGAE
ncbi:hypothetical protein HDU96_001821 [Phlyctochytrium bullatum]|nr:hypothetical protein HDU96_001821 [Phlyctochytrium bullatum]